MLNKTFPKHCHNGTQENVIVSNISEIPEMAIREFLDIVKNRLLDVSR